MILSRRKLIGSLSAFIAAPAIVRAPSLMPVRAFKIEEVIFEIDFADTGGFKRFSGYEILHISIEDAVFEFNNSLLETLKGRRALGHPLPYP
jgi:hypothetical protein